MDSARLLIGFLSGFLHCVRVRSQIRALGLGWDPGWDPSQGQGLSQGFGQGCHRQNISQVPQARLQCDHGELLHGVESIVMGCYTDV